MDTKALPCRIHCAEGGADMAIDAGIPLGFRPPQIDDPLTVQTKQLQLRDLMGQQQARQMQLEDAQRARQTEMTLADIYRESGGDPTKTRELLAQRGQGAQIPAFDKERAATGKVTTETDAAKYKLMSEQLDDSNRGMAALLSDPQLSTQKVVQFLASRAQMFPDQAGRLAEVARSLPPDPGQLRQILLQKAMEGLKAKEQLDLMLPQIETRNMGGADQVFSTNRLTGQVTPGQSFAKTATPGEVMSDARQRSEGALNRGVQTRGQDLTNERAREANVNGRELVNQKRQMELDEMSRGKAAAVSSAGNQIAAIDKALSHPGRKTATGLSGTVDPRNYVPGTDATDFRAVLDQIGGAAFLQAFESLKGGGAITEVEGKKATDAIARLNRAQSDKEFETSLRDLRNVMTTGYERLAGKGYQTPAPAGDDSPKAPKVPKAGAVQDGYVFLGGDPGDQKNWRKR